MKDIQVSPRISSSLKLHHSSHVHEVPQCINFLDLDVLYPLSYVTYVSHTVLWPLKPFISMNWIHLNSLIYSFSQHSGEVSSLILRLWTERIN